MRKLFVALMLVATCISAIADQLVIVTAEKLNVRAEPSTEAPILGQVSKGDRLTVTPVAKGWSMIAEETGITGFVSRKYLSVPDQHKAIPERQLSYRHNAITERQKDTHYLYWSLVLVLALTVFLAKAFAHRSGKKEPIDRDTELVFQSAAVSTAKKNSEASAPDAHWDLRDASQTKGLDIGESTKTIQDFPMVKVEHVIDGDTVIVASTWKKTKIRLDSIDCPEDGQPWGDIATAGLIKIIGGRRVRIEEHGEDHYGRLLATIYVEDMHQSTWINVNEKMIAKGHAWVMRKYYGYLPGKRKDKLNRLERWARTRKVGLWNTQNPIPPWKWRTRQ